MPHFIVEYTDNIKDEANLGKLFEEIHNVLITQNNVFPIGGIRSVNQSCSDFKGYIPVCEIDCILSQLKMLTFFYIRFK